MTQPDEHKFSKQVTTTNLSDLNLNEEREPADNQLMLADFYSGVLRVNKVPPAATQTYKGQKLIKPIVNPVKFKAIESCFDKDTIDEFNINQEELKDAYKQYDHQFDHIKQNI